MIHLTKLDKQNIQFMMNWFFFYVMMIGKAVRHSMNLKLGIHIHVPVQRAPPIIVQGIKVCTVL
jgi:hypothetical protein